MADLYLKGYSCEVFVNEDKIVISRRGWRSAFYQGMGGDKTIPMASIQAVSFKRAAIGINGYMQFTITGGLESTGFSGAVHNENAVIFTRPNNNDALRIKEFVETIIFERSKHQGGQCAAEFC